MSDADAPKQRPALKRALMIGGGGAVLLAGGLALALGPAAPWLVDTLGDNAKAWRLGQLEIDGVTGTSIADLRARRIALRDEGGVWAEARDVTLDWRPFALLVGDVRLDNVRAGHMTIRRQPKLTPARPPGDTRVDVRIDALRVERLDVEEAAFGAAGRFSADFALTYEARAVQRVDLALARADSEADRADIRFAMGDAFHLSAVVASDPGGVIAHALNVGAQGFRFDAEGDGDDASGAARAAGQIGDAQFAVGGLEWDEARWRADGDLRLDLLPALAALRRRFGDTLTAQGQGARGNGFTAEARAPNLEARITGALAEGLAIDGPLRIVARAPDLSAIGYEAPLALGPGGFEGELTFARRRTALKGVFTAERFEALGQSVRLVGPVNATLTNSSFELGADLSADENAAPLFAGARLQASLSYDRQRGRFELERARLNGEALAAGAQGWTNRGEGEYSGEWRVRKIEALGVAPDMRGAVGGRWRAQTEPETRIWTITLEGDGENISGAPEIAPQLLGRSPSLDAALRIEQGGVTVSHARIDGAKLRAGARGRIVGGNLNLTLEASARGPLTLGAATVEGAGDATGRLTGALARPALTLDARLANIVGPGFEIGQPQISFTLAPNGRAYRGHVAAQGVVSGQAARAQSDMVLADGGVSFPTLDAQVAALEMQGAASFSDAGATAQLALSGALDGLAPGVSGRILGDLDLTPDEMKLEAQLAEAHFGDLRVRAATLTAAGPLDHVSAAFQMRGGLRRAPLSFAGAADITSARGVTSLAITGDGALAGAAIATRAPLTARWGGRTLEAALDMRVADGAVVAAWSERGRALEATLRIEDAPVAPLAAIWGERATGRIEGDANLESRGDGLAGALDMRLVDARFISRQKGALNAQIIADLDPSRLTARVEANSAGGLQARFEADAPVETSAAPIRIALAENRRGRASWSVRGPAEGLWAATRIQDQALSGQIDGDGELSFGAGAISGDGRIEISGGAFDDKITGVKLRDLNARIAFSPEGVRIENFSARDTRGGTLTATGGGASPEQGRIDVRLHELRLVDRPDAHARASGELALSWNGLESELTGEINILEGDVSIAQHASAAVPQLDVIEINRPGYEDEAPPETAARNHSTTLDVRIRAPGRIYTRGRGVDAEWALDLRLAGTAADPRFYGAATAIRGTLALSGRPFDIQSGRIVFDGAPEDASIDLVAERESADLTARIVLSGTATDPGISFESEPALPEDEILPQILFGRSVEDLSGLEAAQLAASIATLTGQGGLNLADAARAAAGLDRLDVREDENGGVLVAGGVYLSRDVYLEVARTGLGQAATSVEWTVRPRLVLITSFLPNGDRRASIRWRTERD